MDVEVRPAQPAQPAQSKSSWRGKLYTLGADSLWEDTGTGFVAVEGEEEGSRRLLFREEETGKVLHDRPVFKGDTYTLQGEGDRQTIIVWEDQETKKDWALSFQDPDGTADIWASIRGDTGGQAEGVPEKRLLPVPALGNLQDLCRLITMAPPSQREQLAGECASAKFLEALKEAFHTAEDLCSEEALAHLWQTAKGIFLLSIPKLTERYLQADVYEDIMGMLEYDVGLPADKRICHRQVLSERVRFSSVGAFEDGEMLERVHVNYRLQYLKDIVLPRLLDDAGLMCLSQMIQANLQIIFDHVQKSPRLLDLVFAQARQKDVQSLLFVQDACRLAKIVPPADRQALYERMVERKLFDALAPFFEGDGKIRDQVNPQHLAIEILQLSAFNDSSHLRRYFCSEAPEAQRLLSSLTRHMLCEKDQGVQGQIFEMLKYVMDTSVLDQREKDTCLEVFYDRGALDELVVNPLRGVSSSGLPREPAACFGLQLVCELLAWAVLHHGYRAKTFVMRHGLVQQAARLMAAPQRFLQLAPIRLLRAIVATKDDAYHRYLTKNLLFAPAMRNFELSLQPPALGSNLLVSTTLEMLEHIRIENYKILVDHICKKHGPLLQEWASKFKTLQGLLLRHQQNLEYEAFPPEQHAAGGPLGRGGPPGAPGRTRSPGREDSDDDEAYFESLDDDDDKAAVPSAAEATGSAAGAAGVAATNGATAPDAAGGPTLAKGHEAVAQAAAAQAAAPQAAAASPEAPVAEADREAAPTPDEATGASAPSSLKGLLGSYEEEDEAPPGSAEAGPEPSSALEEATGRATEADLPEAPAGEAAAGDAEAGSDGGVGGALKRQGEAESGGKLGRPRGECAASTAEAAEAESQEGGAERAEASEEPHSAAASPAAATAPSGAEAAPAADGAKEAERNAGADAEADDASERGLNHVSKRQKTSASAEA